MPTSYRGLVLRALLHRACGDSTKDVNDNVVFDNFETCGQGVLMHLPWRR